MATLLLKQLRQAPENAALKVILLAPSDRLIHRESCICDGAVAILTKPVKASELFETIVQALEPDLASRPKSGELSPAVFPPAPGRSLRILLAEDNAVNQIVASERLKRAGHSMVVVENGLQALTQLKAERFDLALVDVHMPEMDGFATIAELRAYERENGNHLPVIALTANAMKGDRERCIQAGFDEYVSKPIRFDLLFATIDRLVGDAPDSDSTLPTPPPIVDKANVLARFDQNEEMVRDIIRVFLKSCPRWLNDLQDAMTREDARKLHLVAHSLKGAVGNFTEGTAFEFAQKIEQGAKEGRILELESDYEALRAEMIQLQESLKDWLMEPAVLGSRFQVPS